MNERKREWGRDNRSKRMPIGKDILKDQEEIALNLQIHASITYYYLLIT